MQARQLKWARHVVAWALIMLASTAISDGLPSAQQDLSNHRALGLEGAPNFRDVGGYATRYGKHVRWGVVYRSNELSQLTDADAARIEKLDIAAVVDLRTQEERARAPSIWAQRPEDVYESPKPSLAPVMRTILKDAGTAAGARAGMKSFYADMPDAYKDEYSAMFHRIAAGELPILVHCTAGKDRTGVAMAILLRSVGVTRQSVIGDYELTDSLLPAPAMASGSASPLAQLPEESRMALWQSNREYLDAALDSIDREYGSVDAYVSRALGLTKGELRSVKLAITQ